ncbi:MAG: threonine synthase [Tissierellales bacterium]|jgi:threonine synthase|nr:threonine synthase [Tissierellales bacterium]MBN2827259.1 threonine synthase [Tissierellales bacterium]
MRDYQLRCISCGKSYLEKSDLYWCHDCGPLKGTLEIIYDFNQINISKNFSKKGDITQFEDLLPVKFQTNLDQQVGGTPFIKFNHQFGVRELMIKFDGVSLSGSYKDRASIIAINKALQYGKEAIFCASTGNAASSLAILSAHTALKTYIFVPSSIPSAKLAQLHAAGAEVIAIQGSYDEAFDLSMEIGLKKGWYCRNSAINPYLLEGKKTGAYEIIIQNDYVAPDFCFVGVGDGTIISSICKGFMEFKQLGLIDKIPKVIGVQAEGAATLKKVYDSGKPYEPIFETVSTVADSISVGNPRDVIKACTYMEKINGEFLTVSDDEIIHSIQSLTSETGVFSEPAGAVGYAALQKMKNDGRISHEDTVCLFVTGNGLKDIKSAESMIKRQNFSKEEARKYLEGV